MELSYSNGVSQIQLLGETIGANLDRTASRLPENLALISRHQGIRWTYRDLVDRVDALAVGLLEAGIEVGDRVGIWSPNYAEWVLVQYATAKVGAILVNLNPSYVAKELEFALVQSGLRMLFATSAYRATDFAGTIERVRLNAPALERVVLFGTDAWDDLADLRRLVDRGRVIDRGAVLHCDQPINIQYTSGTTGAPKGATLSHHNILNNGYFVGAKCGYDERDLVCIPVPFYHCFGMVMGNLACTSHGCTMVLPEAGFEARAVLEAVQEERCTSLYGVPTMFIAELAHPEFDAFDLTSLRTGIMAGSPCPVEVMKQLIDRMHMRAVTICYGMTETSPVSTQTDANDDVERRVSTVGQVHPYVEVKIVDPLTGLTTERSAAGELCTRGYSVMLGYWDDAERTAEAIDSARWMHTGDLAIMDGSGYVNIVGRIKDMILRGGENIYPREIEEFLMTHPDVLDAYVIGVPDERFGEQVMAWIRLRKNASCDAGQIQEFCRENIARYKVPHYVKFADDFPMTVTGKIQKFKMRAMAIQELGLEQVAQQVTA